jgi:hypothetical protein
MLDFKKKREHTVGLMKPVHLERRQKIHLVRGKHMNCLRTNRFLPRRNTSVIDQCDNRSDCGRRPGRPTVDGDGAIIDVHEHVSIIAMNPN